MDNKTTATYQFCSDQNVDYLSQMLNWTRSREELQDTVLAFVRNFIAFPNNYTDSWKTVRYMNREFLESVNPNPSTDTLYSQFSDSVLMQEEVYPHGTDANPQNAFEGNSIKTSVDRFNFYL